MFNPSVRRSTTRYSNVSKRARVFIPARARGPISSVPPALRTPRTKDQPTRAPVPTEAWPTPTHSAIVNSPGGFECRQGPLPGTTCFSAMLSSTLHKLGGDFIVARHGVGYSYQLAVVADDITMGVNQVIRGIDLVPSTPRQILLYHRLGLDRSDLWPCRTGRRRPTAAGWPSATAHSSFRLCAQRGVDPRRLVGSLIHSCGWSESVVPMTPAEAIERYAPSGLRGDPWVVTPEWLEWLQRPF